MATSRENAPYVLVVDDNEDIRDLVSQLLLAEGYRARVAHDGDEMLQLLARERPDLILLDVMLPGKDGFHLCRQLAADPEMPPIIFLTAKDDEIDRVVGLELGADDYVVKPFGRRELVARIKAVLRRAGSAAKRSGRGEYLFNGWRFSPARMELYDPGGTTISLSTSEAELLLVFVQNPGLPLSRDRLLDLTKGRNSSPFDRSVDSHISRLRRKLRDDSKKPSLIKTAWGVGYIFSCQVEAV